MKKYHFGEHAYRIGTIWKAWKINAFLEFYGPVFTFVSATKIKKTLFYNFKWWNTSDAVPEKNVFKANYAWKVDFQNGYFIVFLTLSHEFGVKFLLAHSQILY